MRNLPAFTPVRKALAVALWAIGGAGWAFCAGGYLSAEPAAMIEVEKGPVSPLWPEGCLPVVASGRGKRYYFAWCEAAGKLKPQNLRHFCGPEEAEKAGFLPAEGCVEPGG